MTYIYALAMHFHSVATLGSAATTTYDTYQHFFLGQIEQFVPVIRKVFYSGALFILV
jgi:hypothetical protein